MKEKWICPNLDVQVFTPQEFCNSCWIATVQCLGESASQGHYIRYITFPPDTHEYDLHWNGHTNHPVTYYLSVPDGIDPREHDMVTLEPYIIGVYDPQYAATSGDIDVAHGRSTSGHEQYDGWGWLVGGNVHFTYDPTFSRYQDRPNHS